MLETDFVSERIVKTRLKYEHRNETIIQIYAPCNDTYSEEKKAECFEKLSGAIDSVPDNDDLIVMGDFNGRVGPRRTPRETYLGPHSDVNTECNYNVENSCSRFVLSMVFGSQTLFTIIDKAKDRQGTNGTTSACHLRLISS